MKNQNLSIRKIVTYLNNEEHDGGFWLPNIQRQFVWNEDQIERLFDSILRQYPISTMLVWRTKLQIRRRKFIDNYKHDMNILDQYVPEDKNTKLLVLDGQQRLQSLFIGLKGSYDKRELYIDLTSGKQTSPEDIKYKFKFLSSDRAKYPFVKFKELVFSNDMPDDLVDTIISKNKIEISSDEKRKITKIIWMIQRTFVNNDTITYQELDGVDNPDLYDENDVVEIFIRANSGGTKLGKSDLLFSLLTASWEEADENLHELLEDINKDGFAFTRDFVLKTCLSVLGKGARYDVMKFRETSTSDAIINNWKTISNSIRDVKDFLCGKTYIRNDRAIPSYLALIPIIFYRYHFENKWKSNGVRNLDEYILRTLIAGAFSGTPDNLIDRCTRHISEVKEFNVNELFGIIRADGRNLEIVQDSILDMHYGSKNIHLLFNLWYKDFNYTPTYANNYPQIDHIFPQSFLKSIRDVNPNGGKRNIVRYKWWIRDQIANCMLLTAEENGAGGKTNISPEEWFADKPNSYLEKHLIPEDKELWKLDNFEKFIEARKMLILNKFDYLIEKN